MGRPTATLPTAKAPQPTTELTIRFIDAEQMLQCRMTLRTPGPCTPLPVANFPCDGPKTTKSEAWVAPKCPSRREKTFSARVWLPKKLFAFFHNLIYLVVRHVQRKHTCLYVSDTKNQTSHKFLNFSLAKPNLESLGNESNLDLAHGFSNCRHFWHRVCVISRITKEARKMLKCRTPKS